MSLHIIIENFMKMANQSLLYWLGVAFCNLVDNR